MIGSPEAWEKLFDLSGFADVLSRKAAEAAEAIRAGTARPEELLAESAWEDVRGSLYLRLRKLYAGVMPKALAAFMGMGEFAEKVFFCDDVTPGLLDAVRGLAESIRGGGWDRIAGDFPVAVRYEKTIRANFIASQVEFLERYAEYRPEISRRFFGGREAGRILSYLSRETVLKQHGRTVLGVACEGGTFYYKPRDCGADAFYRELVEKHFRDVTRAPDVIEGDGFGFCTELVKEPLENEEDIGRFFFNFGALSALYLGLNGGDLHAKNVLACGRYPASIDLEDLLTPKIRVPGNRFKTDGEKAEGRSLSAMAVLPARDFVTDSLASSLHLCRDFSFSNLPVFGGKVYDITGYEEEYIRGFREGYGRMVSLRDEVIGSLEKRRGMTLRSLYNSPTVQTMAMDRVLAPEFLASEEKTEREIDRLRISFEATGKAFIPEVFEYEKKCIRDRDLPYYCADLFSADLYGNDTGELLLKDGFEESPFDSVRKKLYSLGKQEMRMEEMLIRNGLEHAPLDAEKQGNPVPPPAVPVTGERIRSEIGRILDQTARDMITAPDGTAFWKSGAVHYASRKKMQFYVLQADVLRLCGSVMAAGGGENAGKAEALAERCLDGIAKKMVLWRQRAGFPFLPGISYGMGSLLNGLASAERAGISRGRELLDELVRLLCARPETAGPDLALATGTAGLLSALCGIPGREEGAAEESRLGLIARLADGIAERLRDEQALEKLRKANDPFTGIAGAGAALTAASGATGIRSHGEKIREIFAGVSRQYSQSVHGWYSDVKGCRFRRGGYAAGIGMCALRALGGTGRDTDAVRECLELSLRSLEDELAETPLYDGDTLRNGNALRILFLHRCEQLLPGRGYGDKARGILAAMVGRKQETGEYIIFPPGVRNTFDPSFMLGTAGIGGVLALFG